MGLDYAFVHLQFTIPPAIAFTFLYWPLFCKLDVYKTFFLITVAVISTIPWDSYLIRNRIWTYPPNAVLGPVVYGIPVEELFFFIIQTYDVSLLYLIITKSTFAPQYLPVRPGASDERGLYKVYCTILGPLGQFFLVVGILFGALAIRNGGRETYLGLILVWAFPFLLLLWTLSHRFILRLPSSNVLVPIAIPTLYLWLVDTFSLKRGTWVIERGTKTGLNLWPGLEIEEAFFFLVTNTLIVFGLNAFDHAMAILDTFPEKFSATSSLPSPILAVQALMLPVSEADSEKITGLSLAVERLKRKSRSFHLASSTFTGRLRVDLILLYSFCRIADDLVDNAADRKEAETRISHLRNYLDMAFSRRKTATSGDRLRNYISTTFPPEMRVELSLLPISRISPEPLYDLLRGFEVDLNFNQTASSSDGKSWPIKTDSDLEQYGAFVAGTVAELCIDLACANSRSQVPFEDRLDLKAAGRKMGIALQIVNIARDIQVDAKLGRVYIPTTWLAELNLTPTHVIKDPDSPELLPLRSKLLDKAFKLYGEAREKIEDLPDEARRPMRVAIESYMEIGRVLQGGSYTVKAGKATVPKARRLLVAWKALSA